MTVIYSTKITPNVRSDGYTPQLEIKYTYFFIRNLDQAIVLKSFLIQREILSILVLKDS